LPISEPRGSVSYSAQSVWDLWWIVSVGQMFLIVLRVSVRAPARCSQRFHTDLLVVSAPPHVSTKNSGIRVMNSVSCEGYQWLRNSCEQNSKQDVCFFDRSHSRSNSSRGISNDQSWHNPFTWHYCWYFRQLSVYNRVAIDNKNYNYCQFCRLDESIKRPKH
jgi:hypothetical protein